MAHDARTHVGDYTGWADALASVPNLRDVGGQLTTDGRRVRTDLLFRSSALGRLKADIRANHLRPRSPKRWSVARPVGTS